MDNKHNPAIAFITVAVAVLGLIMLACSTVLILSVVIAAQPTS